MFSFPNLHGMLPEAIIPTRMVQFEVRMGIAPKAIDRKICSMKEPVWAGFVIVRCSA